MVDLLSQPAQLLGIEWAYTHLSLLTASGLGGGEGLFTFLVFWKLCLSPGADLGWGAVVWFTPPKL